MKNLLAALAPIVEFHKTVETASENDLRLYWDVRLVQGKDTPFTSMSGHSSFPGVLVGAQLGQLPHALSREIVEKIAVPLAARIQDMTNEQAISSVMKNAQPANLPAKPAKQLPLDPTAELAAEDLLPDSERNEALDVMLPKEVVAEAAGIISELKKSE